MLKIQKLVSYLVAISDNVSSLKSAKATFNSRNLEEGPNALAIQLPFEHKLAVTQRKIYFQMNRLKKRHKKKFPNWGVWRPNFEAI
jgi:hypothetical protein